MTTLPETPETTATPWLKWGAGGALVVGLLLVLWVALQPAAEETTEPACPAPCHAVAGEFIPFYNRVDGEAWLGRPIRAAFADEREGVFKQYFEGAMLVAPLDDRSNVSLFPLGEWAVTGLNEVPAEQAEPQRRSQVFENGLVVQDDFLDFYDAVGGEAILGRPVSPIVDGSFYKTQYFENAALSWHPELGLNQRVLLLPLGIEYFQRFDVFTYENNALINAIPVSERVTTAVVKASVTEPILFAGETQELQVAVETDSQEPVANVEIFVVLSHGGTSEDFVLGRTDIDGLLSAPLAFPRFEAGSDFKVHVEARYSEAEAIGETQLSFRTWW